MFAVVSDASWVFEPLQIADEPFRMICHALAKEDFLYASTFLIHVLVAVHAVLRPIDAGVRRCLFALHTSWDNGARSRTPYPFEEVARPARKRGMRCGWQKTSIRRKER